MEINRFFYKSLLAGALMVFSHIHGALAQTDISADLSSRFSLLPYRSGWQESTNAAGLALDPMPLMGRTLLLAGNLQGTLKQSQQARQQQQFQFFSERYQTIGSAFLYGSFSYTQQKDKDIFFSDVMDPYRGTPYVLADSIGGDWKKQFYALKVRAASPKLWGDRLILGLGVELHVGTGARQNDPRPLTTNNEIKVTPGLTLKMGENSHVGLNGYYSRYREEVSLEVKNTSVNHYLYKFLGMGQYELPPVFSSGASRTYNGNTYGGDAQYNLNGNQYSWLTSVGYRNTKEPVLDGTSVPRKNGTWTQELVQVNSILSLKAGMYSHRFELHAEQAKGTGTEFHEYYNTATKLWQTILEAPFYTNTKNTAELSYTLIKGLEHTRYNWLAGFSAAYSDMDQIYLTPRAEQLIRRAEVNIRGAKNIKTGKDANLELNLVFGYSASLDKSVKFQPIAPGRTLIALEVLYPDYAYWSGDRLNTGASMQYDFKLNSVKNARFYALGRFSLSTAVAGDGYYENAKGSRSDIRIGIGAFY